MTGPGRTVCLGEWGGVFPHPSQSFRRKLHETFVSFVERTCVCVCVYVQFTSYPIIKWMQL